jgi:hypothetical protein
MCYTEWELPEGDEIQGLGSSMALLITTSHVVFQGSLMQLSQNKSTVAAWGKKTS